MDLTNYKKEIIQLEKELKNTRLLSNKREIIPELASILTNAIDKRVKGKTGIAFSGGVDSTLIAFIFPLTFIIYIERFVIPIEEKNLEKKFGKKYLRYKQKVRRWI